MTLSEFLLRLLKVLEAMKRKKTDREIEEACRVYQDVDKQIAADWEAAESKL